MVPLLLFLTAIGPTTATTAGSLACSNITSQLGSSKVSYKSSFEYAESLEYWSTPQDAYQPSCVVHPKSAQDVSVAIQAIRSANSRFAVKAGGHNPNTFYSSVDQGILLDLNNMTQRSYDNVTTLATYEPGGVFGDIYGYYAQYNRTVVGARLSGVGTGLALGGGMSYLSPQYGMACDSFRELEIVLPDGQIVTASDKVNPDLFFASRGGGGNAYGIVTKYTVQSRPIGQFFAGQLIYAFEQKDSIIEAIQSFMRYNTDPKAAIIGTYEKLGILDLDLNIDEAIIMFLVYDGPDPGDAFSNFTRITPLLNTMSIKTYLEVADSPTPIATEISSGNNIFRVGVHHLGDEQDALDTWRKWAELNKDASKAQGGNAMQMPDGPWYWLNYLISTPPSMSEPDYNAIQASFRDMVASTGSAEDLPLFINDASHDQNPLQTFSTFSRLQDIKKKYDPDNFFGKKTGGWSFE